MTADYELLGPAEQHIASELTQGIEQCLLSGRKLVLALEEIDIGGIQEAMLDAEQKKAIITTVPLIQGLAKNLAMAELTVVLTGAFVKPKKDKAL